MKLIFYLSIFCLLLSSCRKDSVGLDSKPLVSLPPEGYKLVWSDEFNGSNLDTTKWSYRGLGLRRQAYNVREAVFIDTILNELVISNFMRNDTAFTGMIGTQRKFQQKFGYYECRARVDSISMGHWAAFWLQSPDMGRTLNPIVDGMEIDIMEFVRGDPYNINHALHWNGYGANQQSRSAETRSDVRLDNRQYHVYALEWTPEYYRFFVDSRLVWEVSEPISHMDQYIILSCEISDRNAFKRDFGFRPTNFVVDYVRVYAKQ